MGFLDKIKDLFSDEEEVVETKEIEVEEKEEHKLPTFMRNKIEEEQKREEEKKIVASEVLSDRELVRTRSSNNNFSFPMDIDEPESFKVPSYSNQNVLAKKKEEEKKSTLYTKKEEPKPKKFKPTPVISPVYGILDKNYTKDEVKIQDEKSYEIQRAPKKVDFETVRNKAFGSLTDEIRNNLCENCELYQEVKITKNADKKKIDDSNLLADMIEDTKSEDISLGTAEENYFDFGVSYEQPKTDKPDVVINTNKVELDVSSSDIKIVNHNEEESSVEKIEVKELPKRSSKKTITEEKEDISTSEELDNKLESSTSEEENDIFNLIDSMYDEEE